MEDRGVELCTGQGWLRLLSGAIYSTPWTGLAALEDLFRRQPNHDPELQASDDTGFLRLVS